MEQRPVHIVHWGLKSGNGGIETLVMNLYRHIDREKVQFDFLTNYDAKPIAYEDEILSMGGHVYRVMYPERKSFTKAYSSLWAFYTQHPEIQGVHVHANFPYAFPLKVAKKCGIGLRVLHSHNNVIEVPPHGLSQKLFHFVRDKVVRSDVKRYPTDYFACSTLAGEWMFPDEHYKNGIDVDQFAFHPDIRVRVREQLGLSPSTMVIGFAARLREQKNPIFLLDIFAEYAKMHPDSMLMVVGVGELRSSMDEHIRQLGIGDKVRFMGQRTDMPDLYQAMDAYLMPSLFEGLGIVYIEAQCSGLPCLASKDTVPETAKVTELCDFASLNEDARYWAEKLDRLISANPTRFDHSQQVRRAGFAIENVSKQLEAFYLKRAHRS